MNTDQFNHAPAELFLYTGNAIAGNASMGSWLTYGLGSVNQDLPGFVVLVSGGTDPTGGKSLWSSGFLPSVYQGVQCRSTGEPILYLNDPAGMTRAARRESLNALDEEVMAQAQAAYDFAEHSPEPELHTVFEDIFAPEDQIAEFRPDLRG